MVATSEFLARIPRRKDGKRDWHNELKARAVVETLIEATTVKAVANRYELMPTTVSDWRRMAQACQFVLTYLDGIDFVPVQIEASRLPMTDPKLATHSDTIDLIEGDITGFKGHSLLSITTAL